jgi:HlyD family secretion protein
MDRDVTPALQSIQRYMVVGMIMFGFVTFGIGGWAATSQLSGAVVGQGVVVVDSSVKKVQHATGGIVGELRVREGDRVNAGDILIRLDETQTLANATIVTKSLDELLARQARLEAERDNADQIVFPKVLLERTKDSNSEAGRAIAAESKLFDLRRQARSGQKAQLKERSTQLQEQIKGYLGQADCKRSFDRTLRGH